MNHLSLSQKIGLAILAVVGLTLALGFVLYASLSVQTTVTSGPTVSAGSSSGG